MDSDTGSDSSHVSATPPRQSAAPPPRPTLLSSSRTKSRVRVSPLPLNPKPFRAKRKKPPPEAHPQPSTQPDLCSDPSVSPVADLSNLSGFSLRISRPSARYPAVSVSNSIDQLPAGFFSKSSSLSSRFKNRNLSFDPVDVEKKADFDNANPAADTQFNSVGDFSQSTSFRRWPSDAIGEDNDPRCPASSPSQPEVAHSENARRVKFAKEHPNSIGANVSLLPAKRPKCGREGNFVRLNINGYGRKFGRKGARRKHPLPSSSRVRKSRLRSKQYPKSGSEAEAIICDEDGLVSEPSQRKECSEFSCEFSQTVMAAREELSDNNLRKLLKLTYGHDSFREGQLEAIKLVVSGQSTMLLLPTGAGKSLCYQLPALILPGLTLVISPLVALMVDQLRKLPPMLSGGLLCSNQTSEEASETLQRVRNGTMKVLFVSPERFSNVEFLSILGDVPLISLVVVDEAHCISEWSHNFRPSYMRLRSSLVRSNLNVKCFLAMTATATAKTLHTVVCALEIPSTNIIQTLQIRSNLQLNVTLSENRMKDLLALMQASPLVDIRSVIIYCKFQSETDIVSKCLCDNNISAKSYHSGIPAKERSRIQELFCSNKIRVVVATVAFGMGLDKSDVGAVIHFSLPESLEEYVQETGRAGRDGRLSHCYLLLDDITYFKLRSFLHSDGIDEYTVNKFLVQVFNKDRKLPQNVCSLIKESTSQKFDMKEEVMHTVLTYLELGPVKYIRMLPQLNVTCYLHFHKTSPALLSSQNIVVAMILKKSETKQGHFVFDIPTVANSIGIGTIELLNQLQHLKSIGEITYEMKDPAFCYVIVQNPVDFCSLTTHITQWLHEAETCKVQKLDAMYNAAMFAAKLCNKVDGCSDSLHTSCLQKKISDYFSRGEDVDCSDFSKKMGVNSPFLRADIKVFLQSNSHAKFTPRAIARIMHGISSPAFPLTTWSKSHFWGRYSQVDFRAVMEAATSVLMHFVGKGTG